MKSFQIRDKEWVTVDDIDEDLISSRNWNIRCINKKPYVSIYMSKSLWAGDPAKRPAYYLHRDIAERMGVEGHLFHRDGDTLNCCRENIIGRRDYFEKHFPARNERIDKSKVMSVVKHYDDMKIFTTVETVVSHLGLRPYSLRTLSRTLSFQIVEEILDRNEYIQSADFSAYTNGRPVKVYSRRSVPTDLYRFPFGAFHGWRALYNADPEA